MIPLAVPNFIGNERKYLNNCIDTTFVSSIGEYVTKMEKMTADISGTSYAAATSSGTTGLHISLLSVGVCRDDLVIIPSFTFIATANAVSHCGAIPWLIDISEDSWTMDPLKLKKELETYAVKKNGMVIHKQSGRRISAIMPVYTLGNVADMNAISQIALEWNLPVIADAAAALGAKYINNKIGKLADLTVFSFNGNKTFTAGGGGIVVGNNELLVNKVRHLSSTARITAEYDHDMVGYNYRMTNIQAAVGCAQLECADIFIQKKRYIRNYYRKALSDIKQISFFPEPDWQDSACWFSGIVFQENSLTGIRNFCDKLKINGIEARSFWKPVHLQKPYKEAIISNSLNITSNLWDRIVTLPCSTGISDEELEYVIRIVKKLIV